MKGIISRLGLLFVCFALVSCVDQTALSPEYKTARNRTVLFYMAGDNGLGDETQEKIEALLAAWKVEGNNRLLIYQDRGEKANPRLVEICSDSVGNPKMNLIEEYSQENSATSNIFMRVLNDMVRRYPTSDYGLVVFSHGSGWLPSGVDVVQSRSVVTDGRDALSLIDFAEVIPDHLFRFMVFESCLMAGIEVAYELKDKTEFILASAAEIVSPGFTPLYGQLLHSLYEEQPSLQAFAESYYNHCQSQEGDGRSATVSLIKTDELKPFKAFVKKMESRVADWDKLDRLTMQHFDRRRTDYMFYDFSDYVKLIGTPEEIEVADSLLALAVTYQAATEAFMLSERNGFKIERHSGLTIYIPVENYPWVNQRRRQLALFK